MTEELKAKVVIDNDDAADALQETSEDMKGVGEAGTKANQDLSSGFKKGAVAIGAVVAAVVAAKAAFEAFKTEVLEGVGYITDLAQNGQELVANYDVQARAVTGLAQSMKNQGVASRELVADYEAWASSVQGLTNVGDEVILNLAAQGGAAVGFSDTMRKAITTAIDVSAATGTSLEENFRGFLRAAETGGLELKGFGTIAVEGETKIQKLESAIEKATEAYGGFAEVQANIGAGPLVALSGAFGDFRERLEEALANSIEFQVVVEELELTFVELGNFIADNMGEAASAAGKLFLASFNSATAAVKLAIGAVKEFGQAIGTVINFLETFSVQIGGERFGLLSPFQEQMEELSDTIERGLVEDFSAFSGLDMQTQAQLIERFRNDYAEVFATLRDINDQIEENNNAQELTPEIVSQIEGRYQKVLASFRQITDEAQNSDVLGGFVAQAATSVFPSILEEIGDLLGGIKQVSEATQEFRQLIDDPTIFTGGYSEAFDFLSQEGGPIDQFDQLVDRIKAGILEGREDLARNGFSTELEEALKRIIGRSSDLDSSIQGVGRSLEEATRLAERLRLALEFGEDADTAQDPLGGFIGNPDELISNFGRIGEAMRDAFLSIQDDEVAISVGNTFELMKELLAELGAAGSTLSLDWLDDIETGLRDAGESTPLLLGSIGRLREELQQLQSVAQDELLPSLDVPPALQGLEDQFHSVADSAQEASVPILDISRAMNEIPSTIETELRASVAIDNTTEAAEIITSSAEDAASVHEEAALELGVAGGALDNSASTLDSSAQFLESAGGSLEDSSNSLSTAADGLDQASQRTDNAADALTGAAGKLRDAASTAPPPPPPADSGDLRGAANALIDAAGDHSSAAFELSRAASELQDAARSQGQGGGGGGLQFGGIVTAPSLSTTLHGPEAVIPLNSRGQEFMRAALAGLGAPFGGSGGSAVNIFADRLGVEELDRVAFEVEHRLVQRLGNSRTVTGRR